MHTADYGSNGILCRLNVNNHLSYVDVHKNIETYNDSVCI